MEIAEEFGEEALKTIAGYIIGNLEKGGRAYKDYFKSQTIKEGELKELDETFNKLGFKNSSELDNLILNVDKATTKILNPREGYFIKTNRFAGSMANLKNELYRDEDFIKKYYSLLQNTSLKEGKNFITMQHYEIDKMINEDKDAQIKIVELINQRTKYNLKTKEDNKNMTDNKTPNETPINPPIPTKLIQNKETLWAPRRMLGGQDILRLTDTEKLEELKNYTLFDLVTPLLEGDSDNLLAIQNDIQKKIRYYNNYPLPKVEKPLPPLPNLEKWRRPMMNQNPVPYPFHLDNTGNQQTNKYYNMFSDQDQTQLNSNIDIVKRGINNPDVMQILNTKKTKEDIKPDITEEDLFIHFRR